MVALIISIIIRILEVCLISSPEHFEFHPGWLLLHVIDAAAEALTGQFELMQCNLLPVGLFIQQ